MLPSSIRLLPALALLVAASTTPGYADPGSKDLPSAGQPQTNCLDTPLVSMADSGVTSSAQLCVRDEGVHAQVATSNLAAGDANTAWFVYFDRPANCRAMPCMPADAIGEDPVGVLGRMDGLVADATGAGTFAGDFRGLRLSGGSQVHLPIYGHGPASTDNRARARQLLTPEDPILGAPDWASPPRTPRPGRSPWRSSRSRDISCAGRVKTAARAAPWQGASRA
jgi:hypothetical protein